MISAAGKSGEAVCAVVVTFNRKAWLIDCLESLRGQDRPVDRIIVIDNASTDGTGEALAQCGWTEEPLMDYFRLETNSGGAGGFFEGMKQGIETGYDWIWLMDDDGKAHPSALQHLLQVLREQNVLAGGPLVVDRDCPTLLSFGLDEETRTVDAARQRGPFIPGRMNPFNGTLLSRKVIEQIGYVKREMFIWGDEREYQHRLERHAIAFGTVTQALFYHPCAQGRFEKVWKGKLGQVLIKPGHMAHIFYRNLGFLDRAYRGRRSAVMNLVRYTGYFLLNRRFDLRGLIKFFAYYLDGFLNTYKLDPALSQAPAVKEATA